MEFSRQGYWSGLPFPSPGDLPDPGIEPGSPALQADSLPLSHQGATFLIWWKNVLKFELQLLGLLIKWHDLWWGFVTHLIVIITKKMTPPKALSELQISCVVLADKWVEAGSVSKHCLLGYSESTQTTGNFYTTAPERQKWHRILSCFRLGTVQKKKSQQIFLPCPCQRLCSWTYSCTTQYIVLKLDRFRGMVNVISVFTFYLFYFWPGSLLLCTGFL